MKIKREVENITYLCNSMKSTIETFINEKKADEQNKNKKVKAKYKVLKVKPTKVKKQSKETNKEETYKGQPMENNQSWPYEYSKCDEMFEQQSCLDSHMFKQHKNKQLLKCNNRDFVSTSRTSIEQHTNTKHQLCNAEITDKRDTENKRSKKEQNLKALL